MYIRVQFENLANEKTQNTMSQLLGIPSGTCLSSKNAVHISSKKIRDANARLKVESDMYVAFWYLDVDVMNKFYGGALNAVVGLRRYPGVSSVQIVPLEGRPDGIEEYDKVCEFMLPLISEQENPWE